MDSDLIERALASLYDYNCTLIEKKEKCVQKKSSKK